MHVINTTSVKTRYDEFSFKELEIKGEKHTVITSWK